MLWLQFHTPKRLSEVCVRDIKNHQAAHPYSLSCNLVGSFVGIFRNHEQRGHNSVNTSYHRSRGWDLIPGSFAVKFCCNAGIGHVGLVGFGPNTTRAIVLKSCQKQLVAQCPGCWCCTNDAQWTAQISKERGSQTAHAKSLQSAFSALL